MKKVIIAILSILFFALVVRADDAAKYRAFVDTIKAEVFATELTALKTKDIPEKYRNSSAVIKAVYESVEARKKTGVGVGAGMFGLPTVTRRARVEFGHLQRMLVHVNDKAAIEKYSEFEFDINSKESFYKSYEKSRYAMGVRLIKPDGRIIDIDTSEFIDVEEGKKGEKKSRKLAVPGIEPGDDIDLFFFIETKLQNIHPDPIIFKLKAESPILNYKIHCVIDDKLTTQYRTLNGAPDFNVSRDEDNNYVLDLELNDITSHEPRLWYNAMQQSPLIAFHVFNRRNSEVYTPKSAKKDGLQANPDVNTILEDRWDIDDNWIQKDAGYNMTFFGAYRDERKIYKTLEKEVKNGTISKQQIADFLYNYIVFAYLGNRMYIDIHDFAQCFKDFSKHFGIVYETGLSSVDNHEPLDQLINVRNNVYFFRDFSDSPRYYIPPLSDPFIMAPGEITPILSGRTATIWQRKNTRKSTPASFFSLPEGTIDNNRNISTVNASIEDRLLSIKREEAYRGSTKRTACNMLTWEDIDRGYSQWLNRYGVSPTIKESKKAAADRQAQYADDRKLQLQNFTFEAEQYHGAAPAEFIDARVTNIGIDPDEPWLKYSLEYKIDNCVKTAGRNIIVLVGKLLSNQLEPLPTDRERDDDAYFGSARDYTTEINIDIPSGYKINQQSLSALDKSVKNEAGEFSVVASADDDKLKIIINKKYLKPRLDASLWPDMLKILDSAAAWNSATVVLEKK